MSFNIAIDGPAGAGKSTIARAAARNLGFLYVDTGAMYRAIAFSLIRSGVEPEDEAGIEKVLESMTIRIVYSDGEQQILLNGENVTAFLRDEAVGNMASRSASNPKVREKLLQLQRDLAKENDVIMDGRDIGTFVLPDADVKVYLTASVEERAKRRYLELIEKGQDADMEKIKEDIRTRDTQDMNRSIAPLKQAKDAVVIDSSKLTIPEVMDRIVDAFQESLKLKG
ncbi:(d)CMP kinase [Frisingicoccus sp.]|uniref:(d)CMP kinase n=2 Tax=Frisingicoccus sp. TaxID=1918627 RepID=UPI002A7FBDF7|nr:(d)CMP kinase [Frisingicoccus sp.]MDY4833980.1 (d)CMP kinase [Frisingicoccus sp.]MDY4921886.1 (d)CMP kinase [Frisingicoccus sp.]MDY5957046.1 (d)CMP kinase [Frisingicoccus sp.]